MKKTNALKITDIENYANKLRNKFNVSLDSPFPILDVIEKLHYDGLLTIQYLEDDNDIFDVDTPAKYSPIENFIYVKESVLEELERNEYRANFTLAHELFHYFQWKILLFEFEEVEDCPPYLNPEWQADEFAGQLLVPTKSIEKIRDAKKISEIYKVSEICAVTRCLYFERRLKRSKS